MSANLVAALHGPRDVRLETRALPELGERDVLVEVRSVGVCGSDVHYYEHGRIGSFVVEKPLVLGHEVSGVIVDRGGRAAKHPVGQRVALEPGVPCGRCSECRHGRYNLCTDVRFFATPPIDGAFARYVAIHEDYAFALPDELSDDAGALLEPLSVGIWACQKGGVGLGDRVLVTGAGPIGNLAMQVARAAGATTVVIADLNRDRLARAAELGATRTIDVSERAVGPDDGPFDVLLECTGSETLTSDAMRTLRPAGTAVLVGMGPGLEARIPTADMQAREITLVGTFRYANTYRVAIALAEAGRVDLDGLVDAHFPLEDVDRALRASRENPTLLKVVVDVYGSSSDSPAARASR
ncbi:MAG TPA: NAD(P)-dependent alcohol dehydrogenase [Gaiellaceae bacterium]|nr:NAD(P)-dependent alcohol dehydrogenase [Gaiellaceae bacterium]